jgi:hypothetical protein
MVPLASVVKIAPDTPAALAEEPGSRKTAKEKSIDNLRCFMGVARPSVAEKRVDNSTENPLIPCGIRT